MKLSEILVNESFHGLTGFGNEADDEVKDAVIRGIEFLEEHPRVKPGYVDRKRGRHLIKEPNESMMRLEKAMDESPYAAGFSGSVFGYCRAIVLRYKQEGSEQFLINLRGRTRK